MVGLSDREATDLITSGRQDQMLERILEAYKSYEKGHDFVLIEGTNYQGPTVAFEFDVNADLARTLARARPGARQRQGPHGQRHLRQHDPVQRSALRSVAATCSP